MLLFFVRRYVPLWIIWTVGTLISWLAATYFFDGFVPTLAGLSCLSVFLFAVPAQIFIDCMVIKGHVKKLANVAKGRGTVTSYVDLSVSVISSRTGVPESIVQWLVDAGSIRATKAMRIKMPG